MRTVLSAFKHHYAYIDWVSTSDQLTVDDIFHQVCRFRLAEIDARISEAWICGIVFDWIVEIMPSFDVISRGFVKQKCVFEISKIFDIFRVYIYRRKNDTILTLLTEKLCLLMKAREILWQHQV